MRLRELEACSDEQLLGLYVRGELEAIAVVLARYKRPIYNFVLRFLGDAARAEDLCQETFLRLVERASDFEGGSSLKTWIYRIARNLCIDELRRQKHRRHPSLDAPIGHGGDSESKPTLYERIVHDGAGPERESVARTLAQRISSAIEALPEDQKEVFVLRQVEQLSFAQIGEIAGVSENTIKSRMRYALERLQRALSDYQEYAEELR